MCNEILDINALCLEFKSTDILILNSKDNCNGDKDIQNIGEDHLQKGTDLVKKISSLRLLAKFLGFVTDLHFNNNGYKMKPHIFSDLNKMKVCDNILLKTRPHFASLDFLPLDMSKITEKETFK